MGAARIPLRGVIAAAVAVAALAVAGVAAAAGGGSLSLQVTPSALVPGGPGVLTATFTNTGSSTLTHAVLNVDLAGGTFTAAGSSPSCSATAGGATCDLGNVGKGGVVVTTIAFTAGSTGPWTFNATATWDAASTGKPKGAAGSKDTATASTTATVSIVPVGSTVLAVKTDCAPPDGTVSASTGSEGVDTTASTPPDGLDCTPITDGVVTNPQGGSDILFTKLPATPEPVHVTLTFADDNLPGSIDHEAGLKEYPNFPDLSTQVDVPNCDFSDDVPSIPEGSDSCVSTTNFSADDDDGEFSDVGSMDLLVQSNGNDPGYH